MIQSPWSEQRARGARLFLFVGLLVGAMFTIADARADQRIVQVIGNSGHAHAQVKYCATRAMTPSRACVIHFSWPAVVVPTY